MEQIDKVVNWQNVEAFLPGGRQVRRDI